MAYKHFIEFAARGGIVGGTLVVTNYIGCWATSEKTHSFLQRVQKNVAKASQLAKVEPMPIMEYINTHIRRDKPLQKYNNEIIKTVEMFILTPDIMAKMKKFIQELPLISKLLHSSKITVSEYVSFIKELKFPDEHDKEEESGQIHQLMITEDLPLDVYKAFEQEEGGQCKGTAAEPVEQIDGDNEKDDKEDLGPILHALACTLNIINTKSSSSDI